MGPEGTNVDSQHLWSVDHLSQGPHESTIDPHQLLCVHLVGLIKHHSNLVILAPKWLNSLWKLIRYIQLMGIKQKYDAVNSLSKPLEDLAEVIAWKKNTLLESHHSEKQASEKVGLGMENKGIIASTWCKEEMEHLEEQHVSGQSGWGNCILHFLRLVSLLMPLVFITALPSTLPSISDVTIFCAAMSYHTHVCLFPGAMAASERAS